MSILRTLGRMLGLDTEPDYDILHNERAARIALTRRDLFAAGAALAAGTVMVPGFEIFVHPGWDTGPDPQFMRTFYRAKTKTMKAVGGEWEPVSLNFSATFEIDRR